MSPSLSRALDTLVDIDDASRIANLNGAEVLHLIDLGKFPPPVYPGTVSCWRIADIISWVSDMDEFGEWVAPVQPDGDLREDRPF